MATQTIEFGAPAGQTVTARLFAAGSDTVVATAAAVARTNATGVYTAAFTNLTPGLYRLIGTNAAGTLLCQWWTRTLAATGTYPATETPDADSITRDRMGYLDSVLIAVNSNRTVQVTGSNHVAADIHELQPAVIQSTHFATDALDANALAASFVAEIQAGLSTLTAAQVNAEVLDVLQTDLFGELAAVPGASSSLKDKIAFMFMLARNKVTQTSNTQTLFADNTTTPVAAATTSDVGGTFTRGEFA